MSTSVYFLKVLMTLFSLVLQYYYKGNDENKDCKSVR